MADVSSDPAVPSRAAVLTSVGMDVLTVILAGAVGFAIAPSAPLVWVLSVGAAAVVALVIWRGMLGGSIGHSLLRLRSMDQLSGLPSFRFRSSRIARRGSEDDPFALRPQRSSIAAPPRPDSRPEPPRSHLRLVVDDGTTHTVQHSALIGRDPTVPLDPRHSLVAIPDLTRTISKVHMLVQIGTDGLSVTDLGSSNGTYVEGADAPLIPHLATVVPWGAALLLGDRRVTLEQRRRSTEVS